MRVRVCVREGKRMKEKEKERKRIYLRKAKQIHTTFERQYSVQRHDRWTNDVYLHVLPLNINIKERERDTMKLTNVCQANGAFHYGESYTYSSI